MKHTFFLVTAVALASIPTISYAKPSNCSELPNHETLTSAIKQAQKDNNGGFGLNMWASIVDRYGRICAITYTGEQNDSQWPGSRIISAQKANTANAFSLDTLAISTANLYSSTQPGGSLFGLQESNPVNTTVAYVGDPITFGSKNDPLVGKVIGGINVFGGGLALYNKEGFIIGALGVSGDSSCADHNIAWRTRNLIQLDYVPNGVSETKDDQIIYDIEKNVSNSGFGHPTCAGKEVGIVPTLPPISKKQ